MSKFIIIILFLFALSQDVYAAPEEQKRIGQKIIAGDCSHHDIHIVDVQVTPDILPEGTFVPGQCSGTLCIIRSVGVGHNLTIGNFVLSPNYRPCLVFIKEESGKISVQEHAGAYIYGYYRQIPLDEVVSVTGYYDDQEFVLSFKLAVDQEKRKQYKKYLEDQKEITRAYEEEMKKKKEFESKYHSFIQRMGDS